MKKNEIKSQIWQHHQSTTSSVTGLALELDIPLGLGWHNQKTKTACGNLSLSTIA